MARWSWRERLSPLIGRRIIGIHDDPTNDLLGLVMDDLSVAWIDRDAEGNGSGHVALEWRSLGDPWPCVVPKRAEIEDALRALVSP